MRRWYFFGRTGHSLEEPIVLLRHNNGNNNNNAPSGGTATNKYLHIMVTTLIRNKKPYNKLKDTSVYIIYIFARPAQPPNPA